MDKRIIAIILALIVAVPAAVCMAQYDSEAAGDDESADTGVKDGSTEQNAIPLGGEIKINTGKSATVGLKNNEAAYVNGYEGYSIVFDVKLNQNYTNCTIGTFGSSDSSTSGGKDTKYSNVAIDRTSTGSKGDFTITITGKITGEENIIVRSTVTVNVGASEPVSDVKYYVLDVTVIGADSTITFTDDPVSIHVTAGELMPDQEIGVTSPTISQGMTVYAKGLPAGLNAVIVEGKLKITGMTTDAAATYDVNIVLRDASGVEYVGEIDVVVSAAKSYDYTIGITPDSAVETVSDTSYYMLNGSTDKVTLTITGTAQAFQGKVYIYQMTQDKFQRSELTNPSVSDNSKSYTFSVDGVGQYVIEIYNVDGTINAITLNIIPVSVGSVGLIVIGN